MGRADTRESRNEDHAGGIFNRPGKSLDLRRVGDEPQAIAQPLDDGAGDEGGALKGGGGFSTRAPRGR